MLSRRCFENDLKKDLKNGSPNFFPKDANFSEKFPQNNKLWGNFALFSMFLRRAKEFDFRRRNSDKI